MVSNAVALLHEANPRPRFLDILGESSLMDADAESLRAPRKAEGKVKRFEFGDEVLLAL